ncbi:MAG: sensor histidine kinase, partial [Actinomycetota bacterium]
LELLEDQDAENLNAEQRDTIAVIDRNTSRLLNLIENLLTLSGIEQKAFSLNKTPTDLAALMEGVKDTVFLMASGRSLEVEFSIDDDIGLALVDREQIDRALLNLVTNAIKFTPAGGEIVVSARRDGEDIKFTVADTGFGIPGEDQEKLFSRFFRSSVSNDLAIQGTGLGLVIVKTIVEAHGGAIQLNSRPGEGTTVTFSIPAALPETIVLADPAEERVSEKGSAPNSTAA